MKYQNGAFFWLKWIFLWIGKVTKKHRNNICLKTGNTRIHFPYGKYNLKKYLTTRNFPNLENFEKDLSNCSLKNWPFIFSLVVLLLFDITGYILIDFGKKTDVFQMYPLDINYLPKYKTKKSPNNKKIPSTSE